MRMPSIDLTTGPIGGHILRLAGPVAIGYFFNTLYTLGDAFFAGKVSMEAQAGIGFVFPPVFLMIAISIGLAQANGALISNALGEGNRREGNRLLGESLTIGLVASVLIMLILWFFAAQLLQLAGASGEAARQGLIYVHILLWQAPVIIIGAALNGALNAQGDTKTYGIALMVGAIINLALNALFALGFGWGIAGIALSTIIAQSLASIYFAYKFMNSEIGQTMLTEHLRPTAGRIRALLAQGLPALLNMVLISVGYFILNRYFAAEGTAAVAAFLIVARVTQLVMLPAIGLNIAALALIGQNFGAGKADRVMTSYYRLLQVGLVMMIVGGSCLLLFGRSIIGLFSDDLAVLEVAYAYLPFTAVSLPLLVIVFVSNGVVQAVKRAIFAPLTNGLRLIILPVIFITLFQSVFDLGLRGIFYGEIVSYVITAVFALIMTSWLLRKRLAERAAQPLPSSAVNNSTDLDPTAAE